MCSFIRLVKFNRRAGLSVRRSIARAWEVWLR